MPDWHQYLTPAERKILAALDDSLFVSRRERNALMNRAKQRKHRANRDGKASL
jgi:hypothetical protein